MSKIRDWGSQIELEEEKRQISPIRGVQSAIERTEAAETTIPRRVETIKATMSN